MKQDESPVKAVGPPVSAHMLVQPESLLRRVAATTR